MIGLRLTITPTERLAIVDGSTCRVWDGRTTLGTRCTVYVRWVGIPEDQDPREFHALYTGSHVATVIDLPNTEED